MSRSSTPHVGPPSVEQTLDRAIVDSTMIGLSLMQLLLGAFAVGRGADHSGLLFLMHTALAASSPVLVLGLRRTRATVMEGPAPRVVAVALFHTGLVSLLGAQLVWSGDPLVSTAAAMTLVVAATGFLLVDWWVGVLCSLVPLAVVGALVARSSDTDLALVATVPPVVYAAGAVVLARILRRFARDAEREAQAAREEHERLLAERHAVRSRAEIRRALHDTVVNTLAVLAHGGSATRDLDRVRRRCGSDAEAIGGLRLHARPRAELRDVADGLDLDVAWSGDRPSGERLVHEVGAARATALTGVVRELLLNVEKHAGTHRAVIEVARRGAHLEVVVADDGRGFVPRPEPGRGLAESVLRRADEAGIAVDLVSAPGHGTRVTLRCPQDDAVPGRDAAEPVAATDDGGSQADAMARRTAWWWCGVLTVAGLLGSVASGFSPGGLASVGVVGSLSLVAWWTSRGDGRLSTSIVVVVVLGLPAAYLLGFLGAASPGTHPASWQGIGLSPLLVVLLVVARGPRPFWIGAGVLAATGTAVAVAAWPMSPLLGATAAANVTMQLLQMTVWVLFLRTIRRVSLTAAEDRRRIAADRAARSEVDAAAAALQEWSSAQVDAALVLLRGVADGELDPRDPGVRVRARQEGDALRQMLLIDPDLVHLGPCLARAVATGRAREVEVVVRTRAEDLPDAEVAAEVSDAIEALVRAVPPGGEVTIAWFGGVNHPTLTVVGPRGLAERADALHSRRVHPTRLDEHDLVEVEVEELLVG
jgi:signal transduction histidine kinase